MRYLLMLTVVFSLGCGPRLEPPIPLGKYGIDGNFSLAMGGSHSDANEIRPDPGVATRFIPSGGSMRTHDSGSSFLFELGASVSPRVALSDRWTISTPIAYYFTPDILSDSTRNAIFLESRSVSWWDEVYSQSLHARLRSPFVGIALTYNNRFQFETSIARYRYEWRLYEGVNKSNERNESRSIAVEKIGDDISFRFVGRYRFVNLFSYYLAVQIFPESDSFVSVFGVQWRRSANKNEN